MGRHELKDGHIGIAYGWDHVTGYFLTVLDNRISYQNNMPDTILKVVEKFDAEQSGRYVDMHTGPVGYGHRVDVATMMYFWRQYGAKEEHVKLALAGKEL